MALCSAAPWHLFSFLLVSLLTPAVDCTLSGTANHRQVLVMLCDVKQIKRAFNTIRQVRRKGAYHGELVLFGDESWDDSHLPADQHSLQVKTTQFPPLDLTHLKEVHRRFPLSDDAAPKYMQFHKFYLFHPYFKQWDVVLYIDAGVSVRRHVAPIFHAPWQNALLAHSDAYPTYEWKLNSQFLPLRNPAVGELLQDEFGEMDVDYFQSTVMLYDTRVITNHGNATFRHLVHLMDLYPISETCDQGIMNLVFHLRRKQWVQLPLHAFHKDLGLSGPYYDYMPRSENKTEIFYKA